MILAGRPRLRRALAAAVVAIGILGFVSSARKAVSDTRFVVSDFARADATAVMDRFECVRDAVRAVPTGPTYLSTSDEEWYQRSIEFGFGVVHYVDAYEDAEQVLEVVAVAPGAGRCGDVDITVVEL